MKQQDTKTDSTELIGRRKPKRRGLTVFNLKVIGAIFMFLSVASVTVVPAVFGDITKDMTALSVAMICEIVSWCAIPIYAWLLFDGYRHTHNRWLYLLQLLVLALVCEVPYDKVTSGKYVDMNSQNPVFGLLIALIVMAAFDWVKRRYERGMQYVLMVMLAIVGLLWNLMLYIGLRQGVINVGAITLAFVLVFYLMNRHENTMMITAGLMGAVSFIAPAVGVAFLHYRRDELGYRHAWAKWVFYVLYPLMLVVGMAL